MNKTEPTAPSHLGATEVATTIAALIKNGVFPEAEVNDLRRLLGHGLATHSAAERRHQKLGLLIELASKDGEFISTTRYEEARREAAVSTEPGLPGSADDPWPTASALCRSYGHWLSANKAACRFWFAGGMQRVAAGHEHASGTQASYKPMQIVGALISCRRDLELADDEWPTEWEYEEWSAIQRRILRRSGKTPRLPGLKQIRKGFGRYSRLVEVATVHTRPVRGA